MNDIFQYAPMAVLELLSGIAVVFVQIIIGIAPVTGVLLILFLFSIKTAPTKFQPHHLLSVIPIVLGICMLIWGQYWHKQLNTAIPSTNWQSDVINGAIIGTVLASIFTGWFLRRHLFFFGTLLANFTWFALGCGMLAYTSVTGISF